MAPPQLSADTRRRKRRAVRKLDSNELRDDPAFARLARAASEICDTAVARIALDTRDGPVVLGAHGSGSSFCTEEATFCGHEFVERELVVVEDAARDPRTEDDAPAELGFYVGVPLVLDDVPVGTLATMDRRTGELTPQQRVELFGLVHAAETHLGVAYEHGPNSSQHQISSRLTRAKAIATEHRTMLEDYGDLSDAFAEIETSVKEGLDQLADSPTVPSESVETEAPEPNSSHLATAQTDPESS